MLLVKTTYTNSLLPTLRGTLVVNPGRGYAQNGIAGLLQRCIHVYDTRGGEWGVVIDVYWSDFPFSTCSSVVFGLQRFSCQSACQVGYHQDVCFVTLRFFPVRLNPQSQHGPNRAGAEEKPALHAAGS